MAETSTAGLSCWYVIFWHLVRVGPGGQTASRKPAQLNAAPVPRPRLPVFVPLGNDTVPTTRDRTVRSRPVGVSTVTATEDPRWAPTWRIVRAPSATWPAPSGNCPWTTDS